MKIDRLLDGINDVDEDELPSAFAEIVVRMVRTEGQPALRAALKALEARNEAGELDEFLAAVEDWNSET